MRKMARETRETTRNITVRGKKKQDKRKRRNQVERKSKREGKGA
jgi:hypothetical protein